jgi:hypothetical protein
MRVRKHSATNAVDGYVIAHLIDVEHIQRQTLWISMSKQFNFGESSSGFDGLNVFTLCRRAILPEVAEDGRQIILRERCRDLKQVVAERDPVRGDKLA